MREVEIVRIDVSTGTAQKIADYVAEEKPLFIFLNKTHYATIMCSPSKLKELALGHLLSEGVTKANDEIEEITIKEQACHVKFRSSVDLEKRLKLAGKRSRIVLSACGSASPYEYVGKLFRVRSSLTVKAETILECVNRLNSMAETFRKTGGVHVAAIYKGDGGLVAFAEDVGRHNAVDKAIGIAVLNGVDLNECFLALSGRMSGDIALKAARVGLPIVASLAAALDSGIDVAKKAGLTLVGFVRGKRMNAYTFPGRVTL